MTLESIEHTSLLKRELASQSGTSGTKRHQKEISVHIWRQQKVTLKPWLLREFPQQLWHGLQSIDL